MSIITLPLGDVEAAMIAAGYHYSPVAPIADINLAVEHGCSSCGCHGSIEVVPYHRGPSVRILARCHQCGTEDER